MSRSQGHFIPSMKGDNIPLNILGEMHFHKEADALDINTRNMRHKRIRVRKVEPDEFFQNMNAQQREKLSRDILDGKSKQLSSYQRSSGKPVTEASLMSSMERDVANSMVHMSRHKFASTPFLRVVTSSAIIEKGSPSAKLKLQVEKCKRFAKSNTKPHINYLRDEFEAFDDEIIQSNVSSKVSSPHGLLIKRSADSKAKIATAQCSSIAAAMSSYRSRMMKDRVSKMRDERENNVHDRSVVTMAAQKKKGLMKKVMEFRRLIYKRLDETKNPHMATILRLLDSGVIYNFIDRFKGTTMSIDAVIQNLIGTIPTTELDSAQVLDSPHIKTPSPIPVRPISPSQQHMTTNTDRNGLNDENGGPKTAPASPITTADENAPTDKKAIIESSIPSIKPTKSVFCGGFRPYRPTSPTQTLPQPGGPSKERQDFSYRPKSPLRFEAKKDQTLVLDATNFSLMTPASKSIISLHNQLVIEDALPSAQPEEVLTLEQITRIGSAKDGWRKVEDEINAKKRADLRKHLASGGTKEEFDRLNSSEKRVSPPAGLKAPKSVKTYEFEIDTATGRAELGSAPKSPFLNGDEQGRVMTTGMTGNRFPLMKSRQTKRRGLKLDEMDRYGNPIDPAEIKAKQDKKNAMEENIDENLLKYMEAMKMENNVQQERRISTFGESGR